MSATITRLRPALSAIFASMRGFQDLYVAGRKLAQGDLAAAFQPGCDHQAMVRARGRPAHRVGLCAGRSGA
jgi:hypothetical protein